MKPPVDIQIRLGLRIRELREGKGLSQEAFAHECNLDRTYISSIERGRRNVSLRNIEVIATTLGLTISELFEGLNDVSSELISDTDTDVKYKVRDKFSIECGFTVTSTNIYLAIQDTSKLLDALPFVLYKSIDFKTTSSIIGAVFCDCLAKIVGAIVNPIEKGHPDIIPLTGKSATEEQLRNYPQGLEVKSTVGNIKTGSNLSSGEKRINYLTGITWQAHHREVKSLLGLVWDFAGVEASEIERCPIITGVFYSNSLCEDDWGEISGTTGRNTKVTGMKASGKRKMGEGWIILLDRENYLEKYQDILEFMIF